MASYADTFDRADGELGANWIVDAGDIHIVTNVAVPQTADAVNRARYASAMASADHCVGATFGPMNGLSARQASSVDTCYQAYVRGYDDGAGYRLFKRIAGAETLLDSDPCYPTSGTIHITLTVDGATQVMTGRIWSGGWVEDQVVCTGTDAAITAGTYAGLHGYHNLSSYNDWSAEDLGAAGFIPYPISSRGARGGLIVASGGLQ